MRATVMVSAGDVRIETVPDARVVEAVGADVRTMKVGDVVVMPFAYSDGTCVYCIEAFTDR
jgi:hypothetical protein